MHILVVAQSFWPENFRINDLVADFVRRGHEVTVLAGLPNYPKGALFHGYSWAGPYTESFEGVRVIRAPLVVRGPGTAVRLAINYLSFALSASIVGLLRCRGPYDVVFVYEPSPITVGIPGMVMKWKSGAPLVLWMLDIWPESVTAVGMVKNRVLVGVLDRLVRVILRACDHVLVQSEAFRPAAERYGIEPARVRFFPSWAEPDFVPLPRSAPGTFDGPPLPAGFRLMFAGNIGAGQDIPTLLRAAALVPAELDVQWIFVGDGRAREAAAEQARALGVADRVHFWGSHPVTDMPRFFAEADCMLVSLADQPIFALTLPGKVQTYLACGRPILAMMNGEGARVVEEAGAGLTVPAGDARALAESVIRMAAMSPAARESLGRSGRDYYERHFARGMLFDRLEAWLEDLSRRRR